MNRGYQPTDAKGEQLAPPPRPAEERPYGFKHWNPPPVPARALDPVRCAALECAVEFMRTHEPADGEHPIRTTVRVAATFEAFLAAGLDPGEVNANEHHLVIKHE